MSRSYYEFLAEKRRYSEPVSIPYPDDKSIVYLRESQNPFWERRRLAAHHQIGNYVIQGDFNAQDTIQFISNVAQAERQKELEFLAKFYPSNAPSDANITDKFNILLQSKDRYERLLDRIKNAIYSKNKNMAPNMDALFGSYLHAAFKDRLEKFRASFKADTDLKELEKRFNDEVDSGIIDAVERVANVETESDIYGSGKDWREIYEIIQSDQYLRTEFIKNMRAAIGADNLNAVLKTMKQQKKSVFKQKTTTILAKKLKLSSRTASIGGNVIENTMAMLGQALGNIRGGNETIQYAMSGTAISGEMVKTDLAFIFSGDATIDTQDIARKLNENLSSNEGTLAGAYDRIAAFYEQQKDLLKDLYTVFVNAKNYQLGKGVSGQYTETYGGPLETLPTFLARAGIPVASAQEFLSTAYNTAAGAIREGMRAEVEAKTTNALKAAAAKLMFDDYQTLGVTEGNGIHLFLLSGKYVPSSVVFEAMASSMMESAASSNANITLPGPIDDPGPYGWGKGTNKDIKEKIWAHWQDEYSRAQAVSSWTVSFTLKIKQILM